ncbi:hypothetical protein C8Q77DRAFT_1272451 [Trametes polyzona]|nr:hypothetical protein C8Q77DRAFT_1272451 [Trametes polyzona]
MSAPAAASSALRTLASTGPALKTVAVLGASYGGARAAQLLANGIPNGWRVVLIDRNSHMNHLYVLPRYAVLPGHEHKAFIPYDNVFNLPPAPDAPTPSAAPEVDPAQRVLLHASVVKLGEHELTLDRAFPEHGIPDGVLHFEYLVYALGSHLPSPINLWGPVADEVEKDGVVDVVRGTKEGGVAWLKRFQKRVERASSVLVVGGGALGIQYASDIAEIHPATQVTLLHSRHRLLPRFDEGMHTETLPPSAIVRRAPSRHVHRAAALAQGRSSQVRSNVLVQCTRTCPRHSSAAPAGLSARRRDRKHPRRARMSALWPQERPERAPSCLYSGHSNHAAQTSPFHALYARRTGPRRIAHGLPVCASLPAVASQCPPQVRLSHIAASLARLPATAPAVLCQRRNGPGVSIALATLRTRWARTAARSRLPGLLGSGPACCEATYSRCTPPYECLAVLPAQASIRLQCTFKRLETSGRCSLDSRSTARLHRPPSNPRPLRLQVGLACRTNARRRRSAFLVPRWNPATCTWTRRPLLDRHAVRRRTCRRPRHPTSSSSVFPRPRDFASSALRQRTQVLNTSRRTPPGG